MNRSPRRREGFGLLFSSAVVLAAAVAGWVGGGFAPPSASAAPAKPEAGKPSADKPAGGVAATSDWCDDLAHSPKQPKSGQPVTVTAKVAAGSGDVTLQYQLVDPGKYVERKDPAYAADWKAVPMTSGGGGSGTGPAKWGTFTATLGGDVQTNRRLVRYRVAAKSADGKPLVAPVEADDGGPNRGYFVYDGVPAWSGAIKPTGGDKAKSTPVTFPPDVMGRVQTYTLLGKKQSVENTTWNEGAGGKDYKYTGTLVAGDVVYDHVRFRARGGVWRYALGKNQWKFDLPTGQRLPAKDDFGRPYPTSWSKVNLRGVMQLGSYGRRGEQGLYESVGLRLFNLAGVPAPRTHWVQLRIVDEPTETPKDQYAGDFWGVYLAIENEDGRFLKGHGLPDGNLYKMQNGTGELGNQGAGQPANKSDLDAFLYAYGGKEQTEDWWRANLDLPTYYSYRSVLECIHHYDIADGKNYDYYKNPKTNQWQVIPWDLDLTWGDHMYGNGEEPFNGRVLGKPTFRREYQNRLREVRDLLFNPEQTGRLIDEAAAVIGTPAGGGAGNGGANAKLTLAEADRRRWDFHPVLGRLGDQAGQGRFYEASATKDFAGMAEQMKAYVASRGKWVDDMLLKDPKVPATPSAKYVGPAGFPAGGLRFKAEPYQGADAFAAMQWRLAEVSPKDAKPAVPPAGAGPGTPMAYEIAAVWESPEATTFAAEATVPADIVAPGKTYRLRVRMKDAAGRWSHWSAPVEFVVGGK